MATTRAEMDRSRRSPAPRCEECGSHATYLGIVSDRGAARVLCPQCEAVAGVVALDFYAAAEARS